MHFRKTALSIIEAGRMAKIMVFSLCILGSLCAFVVNYFSAPIHHRDTKDHRGGTEVLVFVMTRKAAIGAQVPSLNKEAEIVLLPLQVLPAA
jgi:hypothetical protein